MNRIDILDVLLIGLLIVVGFIVGLITGLSI